MAAFATRSSKIFYKYKTQIRLLSAYKLPIETTDPFQPNVSCVIDVRSQGEFKEDHIPGAVNLPILNDTERHDIGVLHSQSAFKGRLLGAEVVTQNISKLIKNYFIDKPQDFSPLIYCWRGGQRSHSLALVLAQIGFKVYVLEKGYKTYRNVVKEELNSLPQQFNFKVLSGMTGSGKTYLLSQLSALGEQVLDLECLAKHKGSVLGLWHNKTQPSQKWFTSQIHDILKSLDPSRTVWVESESQRIGKVVIPHILFNQLCQAEHFTINLPLDKRIKHIINDYQYFIDNFDTAKERIESLRKHRGKKVDNWLKLAEEGRWQEFVECLLTEHYDPTYTLSQRKNLKLSASNIRLDNLTPECVTPILQNLISSVSVPQEHKSCV